ncbi:MAG: ArnT family glycosyltransferase [Thermoguttaceae bacterium]
MTPTTEYDVLSYHFPVARTFAEEGQITFQANNVYGNMPFGAELFVTWGMILLHDSFFGAMAGKTFLALTTLLTALGIYSFGKRFFSESVGIVAFLIYATIPWIFYVSTSGLIDSVVGMYVFFALYTLFLHKRLSPGCVVLSGLLAGCAVGCKYPAILFISFPLFVFIVWKAMLDAKTLESWDDQKPANRLENKFGKFFYNRLIFNHEFFFNRRLFFALQFGILFLIAVFITCGGWFVKNSMATGNPVYPLCYSIFGDTTGSLTESASHRWNRVHAPHEFTMKAFCHDFSRFALTSPWNAPLVIPLCFLVPLVSKTPQQRRILFLLAMWILWFLGTWWILTHRIDRFWIPLLPILAIFVGVGAQLFTSKITSTIFGLFLAGNILYSLILCGISAPGKLNAYFASYQSLRTDELVSTDGAIFFHKNPPSGKLLLVGDAKAFLYDVPLIYQSCFNEQFFQQFANSDAPASFLIQNGISDILVDWGEISRFRAPGNYGFVDCITPEFFESLISKKVLERCRFSCDNQSNARKPENVALFRVLPQKSDE